ncbi:DUF7289 family protein [Haloprofundus marisrubri]|nr:hypothetical protein [Haloprofundus marisrubri]
MSDSRAMSDVVGFVLIFAIVVTSVGVVTTFGVGALVDFRDAEAGNNAERGMVAVADAMDEVDRGRSPARSAELTVDRGTIGISDGVSFRVRYSNASTTYEETYQTNALVYRLDGTNVAYESGAVIRSGGDSSALSSSPSLRCSDDAAVVSLVRVRARGPSSVRGDTVRIEMRHQSSQLLFPQTNLSDAGVTVEATSPRQDSWTQYFEQADGWQSDGPGTGVCEGVDRVVVRQTTISVRFVT